MIELQGNCGSERALQRRVDRIVGLEAQRRAHGVDRHLVDRRRAKPDPPLLMHAAAKSRVSAGSSPGGISMAVTPCGSICRISALRHDKIPVRSTGLRQLPQPRCKVGEKTAVIENGLEVGDEKRFRPVRRACSQPCAGLGSDAADGDDSVGLAVCDLLADFLTGFERTRVKGPPLRRRQANAHPPPKCVMGLARGRGCGCCGP